MLKLKQAIALIVTLVAALFPTAALTQIGSSTAYLAHANTLWLSPIIPVCWADTSSQYQTQRNWVRDAVENSWEAVSNVDFTGWQRCTSRFEGIKIVVNNEDGGYTTSLGRSLLAPDQFMSLNFSRGRPDNPCFERNEFCVRATAVHEFGHALGFTHEHNRSDRYMNCSSEPQGTNPTFFVTPYDTASIMNYCSLNWNNDGQLSALDVFGVRSVYGPYVHATPYKIDYTGTISIIDGEVFGSNEYGTREISGQFVLSESNSQDQQSFTFCVGDEVRVELDIAASLLGSDISRSPGNSANFVANINARLFEGTSCATQELEEQTHVFKRMLFFAAPNEIQIHLVNSTVFVDDEALIDLRFMRDVGYESGEVSSCISCEEISRSSRFADPNAQTARPTIITDAETVPLSPSVSPSVFGGPNSSFSPPIHLSVEQALANSQTGFGQLEQVEPTTPDEDLVVPIENVTINPGFAGTLPAFNSQPVDQLNVVSACFEALQDKIAWDYSGSNHWTVQNMRALCGNAQNSTQPAQCFDTIMHGDINWGESSSWNWQNALSLCRRTQNATETINCFKAQLSRAIPWEPAIELCNAY